MKKLYTLALFLISLSVLSQVPTTMNYQGVARYANGNPIIGTIGVKVTIHQTSPGGTPVLTEQYSPITNQFGIFEIKIGTNTAGGLGTISWGADKYYLGVAIDPNGGTSYGVEISNQQLISVPYALYAEKAGNTSPGGSLTASSNVTVTTSGTNTFNINVPNYTAGTNVTITAVGGNNYQINAAGNTATSIPTSPWSSTIGSVFLSTPSDKVGIGTNIPNAKLDVQANPSSTTIAIYATGVNGNAIYALTQSTLGNAAITAQNIGNGMGVYGSAQSSVPGVQGQNLSGGPGVYGGNSTNSSSTSANGVYGETNGTSGVAAGVLGSNFGAGPGVYGWQGPANGGPGVWGVANSSISAGVYGTNSNPNNANAGVMGEITSGSPVASANGVVGKTNSTSNAANGVWGQNTGAGHGVRGEAVASSTAIAGVFGLNTGSGSGVNGLSNGTGYGVRGTANSTNIAMAGVVGFNNTAGSGVRGETVASNTIAAGVFGMNNGMGPGVYGTASGISPAFYGWRNLGTGPAAKFESVNNSEGVVAVVSGTGAAIHSNASAATSSVALWVENGHLKSTGAAPTISTYTMSGGVSSVSYTNAGGTDVKGSILAVVTTTGMINIGGQIGIRVDFNKGYTVPPTVVLTPTSDFQGMSYYISAVTPGFFQIYLKNNTAVNIPGSGMAFNINYMVIE